MAPELQKCMLFYQKIDEQKFDDIVDWLPPDDLDYGGAYDEVGHVAFKNQAGEALMRLWSDDRGIFLRDQTALFVNYKRKRSIINALKNYAPKSELTWVLRAPIKFYSQTAFDKFTDLVDQHELQFRGRVRLLVRIRSRI